MKFKNLFIALLAIGIFSCNNDDNGCADTTMNITSLEEEYGCTNTKYQMDINLSDDFIIIDNQADFTAMVTGSCQPPIDFATYDLVIGKKGLTSGNSSIEYELIQNCNTGNQNLIVTFIQNETAEAPDLTYHALIPKMGDNQELDVEIVIN